MKSFLLIIVILLLIISNSENLFRTLKSTKLSKYSFTLNSLVSELDSFVTIYLICPSYIFKEVLKNLAKLKSNDKRRFGKKKSLISKFSTKISNLFDFLLKLKKMSPIYSMLCFFKIELCLSNKLRKFIFKGFSDIIKVNIVKKVIIVKKNIEKK